MFESVSCIEEDFVRPDWSVRRANCATNQSVQVLKIHVAREVVWREQDEIVWIGRRGIRHEHGVPLAQRAHERRAARLRAAAALIALSRAISAAVSSNLKGFFVLGDNFLSAGRRWRCFGWARVVIDLAAIWGIAPRFQLICANGWILAAFRYCFSPSTGQAVR